MKKTINTEVVNNLLKSKYIDFANVIMFKIDRAVFNALDTVEIVDANIEYTGNYEAEVKIFYTSDGDNNRTNETIVKYDEFSKMEFYKNQLAHKALM